MMKSKEPVSQVELLRQKKLALLKNAMKNDKIRRTINSGGQTMKVSLAKMSWDQPEGNTDHGYPG